MTAVAIAERVRSATPLRATTAVTRTGPVELEHGGRLDSCATGFRLYGDHSNPVVIVLGGISAGRHVASCAQDRSPGWWEPIVGDGRAMDTRRFAVLAVDYVGGPGASTGPAHADAPDPFPAVDTHDQAAAIVRAMDYLGIGRAHAVVGSSYGGMVALALGARHAARVRRLVVVSAAHRSHPMATAIRSVQRDVVRLGLETGRAADALRISRGLAMTTYRTATELAERFDGAPAWTEHGPSFPVQEYLARCGARFVESFDPWSFLALSESIDLHRVDPSRVTVPTTLVAVEEDQLVPAWQMQSLYEALGAPARMHVISSRYGHDAFLKEVETVSGILSEALDGL
ncbi:MAG TPA: homoserine O-succinyltransferase [Gemmatimonadales bacterium]